MAVSKEPREYDPIQDPGNPKTSAPHWSVIALAFLGVMQAGLLALATIWKVSQDPVTVIVVVSLALVGASITAVKFIAAQTETQNKSIEVAGEVTEAKIISAAKVANTLAEGPEGGVK